MIIESIHVTNFLSHADSSVDFTTAPLWFVWGKTGSGKSALLDAVEYALYGIHRGGSQDGAHRGGSQKAEHLVKNGATDAKVEIVVSLHGVRYRVSHTIYRRSAKQGHVDRWDAASGGWTREPISRDSSDAVWTWLAELVPPHDLFRSAIYLRQSDTAHFFTGSAEERTKRFADLIDLSEYSTLSERAAGRQQEASRRRLQVEAALREQGDVSDQALLTVRGQIEQAQNAWAQEQSASALAETLHAGAKEWNRLLEVRARKEAERIEALDLIGRQAAIEHADSRVRAWDSIAVQLDRYWRLCKDIEKWRTEAQEALVRAGILQSDLSIVQHELTNMSASQVELQRALIPAKEAELRQCEDEERCLRLEASIAEARTEFESAEDAVKELAGKDAIFADRQARERALSDLVHLADDRDTAAKAAGVIPGLEAALASASDELKKVQEIHSLRLVKLREWESRTTEIDQLVNELKMEIAQLQGGIEAHKRLKGDESSCPVCDQSLDDKSHDHVRQVLAQENERLAKWEYKLTVTLQNRNSAQDEVKQAEGEIEVATARTIAAEQQAALTEQRLEGARATSAQAKADSEKSRQRAERMHPVYAGQLDLVTRSWVEAESKRVHNGVAAAKKEANLLERAQDTKRNAVTRLATLRSQRISGADPVGDLETAEYLGQRLAEAGYSLTDHRHALERLRSQEQEAGRHVAESTGKAKSLIERHGAEQKRAERAEGEASEAQDQVTHIRSSLVGTWSYALADREAYENERLAVEDMRPMAALLGELRRAEGRQRALEADLATVGAGLVAVPIEHQLPVFEAEAIMRAAQHKLQTAVTQKTKLDADAAALLQRRQRAAECGAEMRKAAAAAEDWGLLSEHLKPAGAIQVWITNQQQQKIVQEVNLVLGQLEDPLCVQLGDPLRRSGTEIQDLVVLDSSDPRQDTRYFAFLSGGEQFRVAMALALALHRRVAGGSAGTIMVDEGFGTLDSDRRDTLARQMADMSGGILRLGLAKSIIMCSHSGEVKRYFPNRWSVEKYGGTATVRRANDEDTFADTAGT